MRPLKILETCLYADDLAAAEQFYRDVLGLSVVSRQEPRHVFLRCGETMLLVFNPEVNSLPSAEVPPHGAHGCGHVAFSVGTGEVLDWERVLTEKGIPIEKRVTRPSGGVSLYFRDPAGNSVELTSPRIWGISPTREPLT
ncbi:MAG: glyoxalase/bleomycin resistance/extradiol dioxygenase family protein [Planctomycetaceae bacterium]|jgi:catechol 2,3-dioxygenase-like lactoylglutathione lyase family enzyme|nr:glyoxalase/bleomycin resistance/extradiol dioxygenase family protein [Planctomycetaceae bacterium]